MDRTVIDVSKRADQGYGLLVLIMKFISAYCVEAHAGFVLVSEFLFQRQGQGKSGVILLAPSF